MPRARARIPDHLRGTAFSTDAAERAGMSPSRLRRNDLGAPFAGVRSARPAAAAVRELMVDYRPLLAPGEFYSHATAAILHGMWLPYDVEHDLRLHVAVHKPQRAPRNRRVRGHHLIPRPEPVRVLDGDPVAGEVETWCQLGTMLSVEDLVVAGDSLLAVGRADAEQMRSALRAASGDEYRWAAQRLAEAADLLRVGHRSPEESRLRLVLLRGGLPEFEINADVFDAAGRWVAEVDLLCAAERVVIEYEGDRHRTDDRQFRKDLRRYELLQDLGYRVVRVTKDDLRTPERRAELVARIRRLLAG